ncbi:Hypothetical predicted protein [Pelobates cultripes]|uniref:Uncharacterized protein n=1 Tax=Pelobates cultripes TaxID=61616 RepID=A0AAD1SLX5_PELCU|nr:Hypothetical predicted protein [Pelobates cultripes]
MLDPQDGDGDSDMSVLTPTTEHLPATDAENVTKAFLSQVLDTIEQAYSLVAIYSGHSLQGCTGAGHPHDPRGTENERICFCPQRHGKPCSISRK